MIGDITNQLSKGISYLGRIFGQPFLYRIVFPSATLLGCMFLPFAVNYLLQLDNDLALGAQEWLWLLAIFIFLIFGFWVADRVASGPLIKLILARAQWRDRHAGQSLRETLEFIENPTALRDKISTRLDDLKDKEGVLKTTRSQIAVKLENAKRRISDMKLEQLTLRRIVRWTFGLALREIRLKGLQFRLRSADRQLLRFELLQNSTARASLSKRALSEAVEAVNRVSGLVSQIDELVRTHVATELSPDENAAKARVSDWRAEFDFAVELSRVIRDARSWRQKLIKSVSAVSEMTNYLNREELSLMLQNSDFRSLTSGRSSEPKAPLQLRLEEIVMRASLLRNASLASGLTSPSTEEHWAKQRSQISTHWKLTPALLARVTHIDLMRTKVVMYAALIVALFLGGPCLVVIGRLLYGELWWFWFAAAVLLEGLIFVLLQFIIWMTVVVALNERALERSMSGP